MKTVEEKQQECKGVKTPFTHFIDSQLSLHHSFIVDKNKAVLQRSVLSKFTKYAYIIVKSAKISMNRHFVFTSFQIHVTSGFNGTFQPLF